MIDGFSSIRISLDCINNSPSYYNDPLRSVSIPTACLNTTPFLADAENEILHHEPVRNLSAISEMLAESELPEAVKEQSIQVFTALGEAEAKTHGSTLDQV